MNNRKKTKVGKKPRGTGNSKLLPPKKKYAARLKNEMVP